MQQQLVKSNLFLIKGIVTQNSPLCGSKPVQLISLFSRAQNTIFEKCPRYNASQKWPKNVLVTNILQIIIIIIIIIFFIMHETLVMHVCLPIFKVAFSMYRNHNCWKHVTCSWMLHFRQCCPRLLLVVMMAAKFKVALLLMILATEEYFTAALMWHLNPFWFWVRV